jgi:hypothetical protein
MMKTLLTPIVAAALLAGCATSSPPPPPAKAGEEASIPFLNYGGVYNWVADGSSAVYIQDQHRRWYHATLMSSCHDLPFAEGIGIETRGGDRLDRFGTILVRGQRCPISSFVTSEGPPKKAKKHKVVADKAPDAR